MPADIRPRHARGAALHGALLCAALGIATAPPLAAQPHPTPDSALRAALHEAVHRGNPILASRRASLAATEARLRATGFAPPSFLSAEVEEVPGGLDLAHAGSARLDLQQEFLSGGRRDAERAVARTDVARAEAALVATEWQLVAVADQRLVQLAGWGAIARRLAAEDSLLAGAEEALRSRFATGNARYVDVLRLRSERLRVTSDRAAAVTEARVSRQLLVGLFGDDEESVRLMQALDSSLVAGPAYVLAPTLPPAPALDSLLAVAGVLRVANADVARADAAQRLAIAERRPRFTASLGAQRFASDDGRLVVGPTVGATVSLPFTARRATGAALEAAARDADAARASRRATALTLRSELTAARDRYEAARTRLAVYGSALLAGAREEREGALASYRSGDLALIELLDFERALSRAEVDRLRTRIDAADALADLVTSAAGIPDAPPMSERRERAVRATGGER